MKGNFYIFKRTKRKASLSIDSDIRLNSTFDETNYVGFGNLAVDGYIRIGGYRKLPHGMLNSYYQGFQGCIAKFKIDDRLVDIVANNLNTKNYPSFCGRKEKPIA
jgi:hypothetical protein